MAMRDAERLREVRSFPQLVRYLRDELDWPIEQANFEDLAFDWDPHELGIDAKNAAKIEEIKQLRPLESGQPWGIFFVKFEPKRLPIVALRRILGQLAVKKRASARKADQRTWRADDLLFISAYGEGGDRQLSFAHFAAPDNERDLPTLRVLGWDGDDTALKLDHVARTLGDKLAWPDDPDEVYEWRARWSSAFVLRPREVIRTSKELAIRLADLAQGIRQRAEQVLKLESDRGPLRRLHEAFKTALIHDLEEGDFADMYAQTITYGLFSAAVTGEGMGDRGVLVANDVATGVPITNPFLRELLGSFLTAGGRRGKIDFDELGVQEVVELLRSPDTHLADILRDFGNRTRDEDPVIHFYESFLKEYDRKRKVERGVFYTPQPVVSYIVRSVHELLQTEFGLEDGLASTLTWREMAERHPDLTIPQGTRPDSPFVTILDPATGTATFLVEVIDVIHRTMIKRWTREGLRDRALTERWNAYVPEHLLPRLFGYELMMAPYAIAHMKVGLKLLETGYRFRSDARARIYLTNALEPAQDFSDRLAFDVPALAHEAQAVNDVKRAQRFTVVIGNPPYSIQSQNLTPTARAWVDGYRSVAGVPVIERNALQFEKNIQDDYIKFIRYSQVAIDSASAGVVGLVTNHGFFDGATFRGMRWSLLQSFRALRFLDLHGNSNKRETSPDGSVDENVFDISQGVAVSLLSRSPGAHLGVAVRYADLWGPRTASIDRGKYAWLGTSSGQSTEWETIHPTGPLYLLRPSGGDLQAEYEQFTSLADAMPLYSMGIKTSRDEFVSDYDPMALMERVDRFRSSRKSDEAICQELGIPLKKGWNVDRARRELRAIGDIRRLVKSFLYRPYDYRFLFYHRAVVFSAAYPVMRHLLACRNVALVATRQTKDQWDVQCTRTLVGHKSLGAYDANSVFPLYLCDQEGGLALSSGQSVNLHPDFLRQLREALGVTATDTLLTSEGVFAYIFAIFHSVDYRRRYGQYLRADFPRVPVPASKDVFRRLRDCGATLISVQLLESSAPDSLQPSYIGRARPEVNKPSWIADTVWLDNAQTAGFRSIPKEVWNFRIGGYQVCEKWLKDRTGRTLSAEDIRHYQRIVAAIRETTRLVAEIDEVIEEHGGWPGAFQLPGVAAGEEAYPATGPALKRAAEATAAYSADADAE